VSGRIEGQCTIGSLDTPGLPGYSGHSVQHRAARGTRHERFGTVSATLAATMPDMDAEELEIEEFIRTLKARHGYDFAQYAPASFKRRLRALRTRSGAESIAALSRRLVQEPPFLRQVLAGLSVPVSEMFRDPWVFEALRREVLPVLASYPHLAGRLRPRRGGLLPGDPAARGRAV